MLGLPHRASAGVAILVLVGGATGRPAILRDNLCWLLYFDDFVGSFLLLLLSDEDSVSDVFLNYTKSLDLLLCYSSLLQL